MAEAGNIQIAVNAVGASDAQNELEGVDESIEETTDSMADSSNEMEGLSRRWQGAFGALVTGLAVASAGLLSQIPVLGEAMSGLLSIVSAVAFQIDSVLRPALEPVTTAFFDLSGAIYEADGGIGSLIGKVGALGIAAGIAVGALFAMGVAITGPLLAAIAAIVISIAALWAAWESNFANIRGITEQTVSNIMTRFDSFVATTKPLITGWINFFESIWNKWGDEIMGIVNFAFKNIAAVIQSTIDIILSSVQFWLQLLSGDFSGALNTITNLWGRLLGIWGPLVNEVMGVIGSAVSSTMDAIAGWINGMITATTNAITGWVNDAATWADNFATAFTDKINELINDVVGFGEDLAKSFARGIRNGVDFVVDAVESMVQDARDLLPGSDAETGPLSDISESGPGFVDTFASSISANTGQVAQATEGVAGAADPQQDGTGISPRGEQSLRVFIGGRQANQGIAQYRDDNVLRRGRPQ